MSRRIGYYLEAYVVLNCKFGKLPFILLGFHIGSNSRCLSFWQLLLDIIHMILSCWN